jgi:hypothetical protein
MPLTMFPAGRRSMLRASAPHRHHEARRVGGSEHSSELTFTLDHSPPRAWAQLPNRESVRIT